MAKLLSVEDLGDRKEYWWLHTGDDGKDRITIQTVEDVEPLLDRNRAEFNNASGGFGGGDFHKVASIPATVVDEICRIRKISFQELMTNKSDHAKYIWNDLLNNIDYSKFRTRPGSV